MKIPGLKAHIVFWSTVVVGTALDLWSKNAVFNWLWPDGQFTVIGGFLNIVARVNDGAAFGIAAGQRWLLMVISLIALAAIVVIFFLIGDGPKLTHFALGLFAAGVCGNFYDRVFNDGLVRDFIDVVYWPGRHWPAFNVADSMLCVAVALLVVSGGLTGKSYRRHGQQRK